MYALAVSSLLGTLSYAEEPTQGNTMTQEIVRLPSGLGYQVLRAAPADAKSPKKGNTVVVQYTGWLDDHGKEGKKFDSSLDRKTPFSFKIGMGQVIAGWDTGVMMMKVGEKCRLFIPANLGYGARGAGGVIPPNAALIFDVELLEVKQ
ncbi:MAG: FKBP-type peptidyl-prolyl cis-trans isomerase [Chlamydiae bacterium]|nr:FKBP-type peptidyl-prolyl cis-trans isomerase [Chlamydiota bacterium]